MGKDGGMLSGEMLMLGSREMELRRRWECASDLTEVIPLGGRLLDVGCGDGTMGFWLAKQRYCSLAQADLTDRRQFRSGGILLVRKEEPPSFVGVDADVALVIDVLQHVGYGHGWDPVGRESDIGGRVGDWLKFLKGVVTGIRESGKVLVVTTKTVDGVTEQALGVLKSVLESSEWQEKIIVRPQTLDLRGLVG